MKRVILLVIVIVLVILFLISKPYSNGVPKIIHQTAPRDKAKWNPIWEPCQNTWRRHFPDYEYRMWYDEDLDNLIKTKYEWFYPTYSAYPDKINRIDAARYFILYEYGGIYADMDYECMKNFEHLIPVGKACATESPWSADREKYQNSLMISPPKHPFWEKVFVDLEEHKNDSHAIFVAGPEVIHRVADANPELFESLPKRNFAQEYDESFTSVEQKDGDPRDQLRVPAPADMYARHHGTTVWIGGLS
jgi:mannosyltransferase OCH1-like enzyme